jgi:hypothetical protein
MFPYAGAQRTYEEAKRIYGLYGATDRLSGSIVVPGVLRHYDISDLIKAIAPRPVTVLNSLHPEPLLPHLLK